MVINTHMVINTPMVINTHAVFVRLHGDKYPPEPTGAKV